MADETQLGAEEVELAPEDMAGLDDVSLYARLCGRRVLSSRQIQTINQSNLQVLPYCIQDEELARMKEQLATMEQEAKKLQEMQVSQ